MTLLYPQQSQISFGASFSLAVTLPTNTPLDEAAEITVAYSTGSVIVNNTSPRGTILGVKLV